MTSNTEVEPGRAKRSISRLLGSLNGSLDSIRRSLDLRAAEGDGLRYENLRPDVRLST